ncbi:MAG: tetratricopeptide repeat protein [Bdellovibrionota bacterium]|nr:tetratricopeptide repeat protein [Bdellovibrionota bacterium]
MKKTIILLTILSTITSCKTQEEIRREKLVDTISVQMNEHQKLNADHIVRIGELEERLNNIQGTIDTSNYEGENKRKTLSERLQALEELQESLNVKIKEQDEKMTKISAQLKKQDQFIDEILKTLKSGKAQKKSKTLSPYQQAMADYKAKKYKSARPALEDLLKGKLSSKARARVIHNLGMISYREKRYEDAMTYFSKLFTEYPKSIYNPNGLIHLAKTFKAQGDVEQAKETLNLMLENYPTHHRVKIAKNLLAKYNK